MESFKDFYNRQGNTWSTKPTVAIVPGSFKPPHKGHYEMIRQYSQLAYRVLVLISAPSAKSQRVTKDGKIITPEMAKKILEIYTAGLDNVDIEISPTPSPVGAAYEALETMSNNPPAETITKPRVVLGSSKKDDDWKRWSGAQTWVAKNELNVDVIDPQLTAVDVVEKLSGEPYSATNIRNNFDDPDKVSEDLPDHVDPVQVYSILSSV